jgi:stage III sporulation protein SpoIIIAA
VAHGKSIHELRKKLTLKHIPQNEAVIDYISSERKSMLL